MSFKSFFNKMVQFMVAGAKNVAKLVLEANIENVVKGGLFLGTTVVSAILLIKALRNKHRRITSDANMSPVDRALALNYTDKRNRDKLDPILSEVKKALGGGKKKINTNGKRLNKAIERLRTKSNYRNGYDPRVLNEIEKFERDMDEITTGIPEDDSALCRAWDRI